MTPFRNTLICLDNPNPRKDYVVTLEFAPTLLWIKSRYVTIRFVPDRHILDHHSLKDYLKALKALEVKTLEELTLQISDDIMDQLLPKWVEVTLWTEELSGDKTKVSIEDQQPGWENNALLSRLLII
jgi:NADPH-dependent 7-cyano-7-deazaguanine reductase QueF